MIDGLSLEGLALTRGDRALFSGFDLELGQGEAAALVGANGAGKTSLLRAVAGLIRPAGGAVRFLKDGAEVEAADARAHALHLLGHHDGLKSARRAWDELLFQVRWTGGTLADAERARDVLKLGPLCDLEVRKLSAGQRRRVALARLVASRRPLWLLDEPFAPLDAERRETFGRLMSEHLAGGGMILAAVHDPLPIPARQVEVGA
ncbi:MAG: ccmA [Caulobacteraceae bacterium]|nr:ccmA [Caulobacteraceae bacterium]